MRKLSKASYGTTPPAFRRMVEDTLLQEEMPMKRKHFSAVLIAAILVIALAGAAVAAISIGRSPEYTAVTKAKAKLAEQYGIRQGDSLTLFREVVSETSGGWAVDYFPHDFQERLGRYHIDVPDSGEVTAYWTHDGTDLTALATAGMESPIWGHAQMEALIALRRAYYEKQDAMILEIGPQGGWSIDDWAELDAMLVETSYYREAVSLNVLPGDDDLAQAEAIKIAKQAISARYGVDTAHLDGLDMWVRFLLVPGRDTPLYAIVVYDNTLEAEVGSAGMYDASVASPSGEVLSCGWIGPVAYRTLPEGPLDAYEEAVREFVKEGAFALIEDEAKRQDIAQRITDAGFGYLIDNVQYAVPEDGSIEREAARAIALDALEEKYGLTSTSLSIFTGTTSYVMGEEGPEWILELSAQGDFVWETEYTEKLGTYKVFVSAESGEVRKVQWTHDNTPVGEQYTRQTFGAAPAWDASIIPWFMEFYQEVAEGVRQADARAAELGDAYWNDGEAQFKAEATHHQRYRDAGFIREIFSSGLPKEDEVQWAEAIDLAKQALMEEYGLTASQLEGYKFTASFNVSDPQRHVWRLNIFPNVPMPEDIYYLQLDGTTGEVIELEHAIGGNG